jgi:hypothetical protein
MDMRTKSATIPSQQVTIERDLVLVYLASSFVKLHDAGERDEATLDALAELILCERAQTLLGLALRAFADKWLRRHLWMVDFDSLSPSDQAARRVIDSAMRITAAAPARPGTTSVAAVMTITIYGSSWTHDLSGTRH